MNRRQISTLAISFIFSSMSMAVDYGDSSTNSPSASPSPTPSTPASTTGGGSSASSNASKSNTANIVGKLVSGGVAVYTGIQAKAYWADCYAASHTHCGMAALMTGMSILSAYQALASGKSAGSAGGTYKDTSGDVNLNQAGGGGFDIQDPGGPAPITPDDVINDLKKNGNINSNGDVVLKDGTTVPSGSFASPESMAAAGFSDGDIKSAMDAASKAEKDALAKAEKKYGSLASLTDGGGGGGGSALSSSTDDSGGGGGAYGLGANGAAARAKLGINRDPAQVAGMQKMYNGEPIGVASDSIFGMMARRYQTETKKESFLAP